MEVKGYQHFERYMREPGDILNEIESDNLERGIALIGPSVGKLLYMVCRMIGARKVLELGTANGYSTIWMARAVGPGGKVIGTEYDPGTAAIAAENFRKAGVSDITSVFVGDAINYIRNCRETFDLVFLDIEKEQYSEVLDDCVRVLRPGGILFADNVAFDTAGDFNDRLNAHPDLETSFISGQFINHDPDEDTISISRKRR